MFESIDYLKISHAILAFKSMGFEYREVPWIVPNDVAELTTPKNTCNLLVYKDVGPTNSDKELSGALIGSAEQGFLQVYDTLKVGGEYVAVSPCFRVEQTFSPGNVQDQFFKVELFIKDPGDRNLAVAHLVSSARRLMNTWERNIAEVKTEAGIDLQIRGVEVGSYGFRESGRFRWVYGTGLALPRFDYALLRRENGTT